MIVEYNERLAHERGKTLSDLTWVLEADDDRVLAATIVGGTLDGDSFECLQGVTWERKGVTGNVLSIDGELALAFAGYSNTMGTRSANSVVAQKEQCESTLMIKRATCDALMRKRDSLNATGLDMRTANEKEDQRGAATVFALTFLLDQMQHAVGIDYELVDSHAPNSANEYSEFGWHVDDHAVLEGGPELEYTVACQCSKGVSSMLVAGVTEELVYPSIGGFIVFPASANLSKC